VALEWVENEGRFPILQPMSEITGVLFALKAMGLLLEHGGVVGSHLARNPPRAMIIGVGHIGANALHVLLQNGFAVTVVDKHLETVDRRVLKYMPGQFWEAARTRVRMIAFDERDPERSVSLLRDELPNMDIVICSAVRRPSLPASRCQFLIDRPAVATMKPNRVLCDATACDRDFIETALSSSSLDHFYREQGVIHYNCDHIPSLAARTATELLSGALFPYVIRLAEGFEEAVRSTPALFKAVMCHRGSLTHAYSASRKNLPHVDLSELL
jgi:alanine dehydrogenase